MAANNDKALMIRIALHVLGGGGGESYFLVVNVAASASSEDRLSWGARLGLTPRDPPLA